MTISSESFFANTASTYCRKERKGMVYCLDRMLKNSNDR